MQTNIILAGVGGQGILTIAKVISTAALGRGWTVKQAEVHGMSQRGGAVYSHVRISDREIYSDLIPNGECDLIVAMEPLESLRYVGSLREDGQIVANTTPLVNITNYPAVEDLLDRICSCSGNVLVDAERLARTAGSVLASNAVLLGAASLMLEFDAAELEGVLAEHLVNKGNRVVEANRRAFRLGRSAAAAYIESLRRGARPAAAPLARRSPAGATLGR
jgi:indolepyruvate ferredoxin oxidoreductase beta subunit